MLDIFGRTLTVGCVLLSLAFHQRRNGRSGAVPSQQLRPGAPSLRSLRDVPPRPHQHPAGKQPGQAETAIHSRCQAVSAPNIFNSSITALPQPPCLPHITLSVSLSLSLSLFPPTTAFFSSYHGLSVLTPTMMVQWLAVGCLQAALGHDEPPA